MTVWKFWQCCFDQRLFQWNFHWYIFFHRLLFQFLLNILLHNLFLQIFSDIFFPDIHWLHTSCNTCYYQNGDNWKIHYQILKFFSYETFFYRLWNWLIRLQKALIRTLLRWQYSSSRRNSRLSSIDSIFDRGFRKFELDLKSAWSYHMVHHLWGLARFLWIISYDSYFTVRIVVYDPMSKMDLYAKLSCNEDSDEG